MVSLLLLLMLVSLETPTLLLLIADRTSAAASPGNTDAIRLPADVRDDTTCVLASLPAVVPVIFYRRYPIKQEERKKDDRWVVTSTI